MTRYLLLVCAAIAAPACTVDESATDGGPEVDADQTDADAGVAVTDAAPAADAPVDLSGPVVEVLSPEAPADGDLSADAIVTESSVRVRCRVAPNPDTGTSVDTSSVRAVAEVDGQTREVFARPSLAAQEYTADVALGELPNGSLAVRCIASDTGEAPRTNSAETQTFLDLGPAIDIVNPVADAPYANQVEVLFRVSAAPVTDGDTGAEPDADTVSLSISGTAFADVTRDAETGIYSATVAFDDPVFDPSLRGENTVTVTAANTRADTAVTRREAVVFDADSTGPTIAIEDPEPGQLVAGIFSLTASIQDAAGIDDVSVVATIAGEHTFKLHNVAEGTYVGSFDTRELDDGLVFPTIIVRARDSVGNQASKGFLVALDNQPPLVSLDPPLMREAKVEDGTLTCSLLFDPVGSDAADDGQSVPQLSEIRGRVEDQGNGAISTGGIVVPIAGVNDAAVQLFILDDETNALIVDTDGDDVCDEINPELTPTSIPQAADEAAVLDLVPAGPAGSSRFADPANVDGATAYGSQEPFDACSAPESDDQAQDAICVQSPDSRQPATAIASAPVVYSIAPTTEDQCWGFAFDSTATNISDGFACAALRAEDGLANVGVSPPLRLCFDADGDGSEGCAPLGDSNGSLPDCTGTFDPDTDTTDPNDSCQIPTSFAVIPALQLRRIDL